LSCVRYHASPSSSIIITFCYATANQSWRRCSWWLLQKCDIFMPPPSCGVPFVIASKSETSKCFWRWPVPKKPWIFGQKKLFRDLEGETVLTGTVNSRTFLNMATRSPDGENGGSPHSPKLLLLQSDYSIVSWRNWSFYASWHDPFDPKSWLGARGTTSQSRAVSLQAILRPQVPSNTSLVATRGRCREPQQWWWQDKLVGHSSTLLEDGKWSDLARR
jgi:hypothetical protein